MNELLIVDSGDQYEFEMDDSHSSIYSSIVSNLVPLNVAMKSLNEKSANGASPKITRIKPKKSQYEVNKESKLEKENNPKSQNTEDIVKQEPEIVTPSDKLDSVRNEEVEPIEKESVPADVPHNPPPESFVGTESRELQLGLVQYTLKISSTLSTEDNVQYLKFVLTYDCLSDNRLVNISTAGSCDFYYRNVKYSIPIMDSYRTSDYYGAVLKVLVDSSFYL